MIKFSVDAKNFKTVDVWTRYLVAFKTSTRKNAKEWYLCEQDGTICKSAYSIDAKSFDSKKAAEKWIKQLGDDRLYVTEDNVEIQELAF